MFRVAIQLREIKMLRDVWRQRYMHEFYSEVKEVKF